MPAKNLKSFYKLDYNAAQHCNTHCNTLQHTATHYSPHMNRRYEHTLNIFSHLPEILEGLGFLLQCVLQCDKCNTLQHTVLQCVAVKRLWRTTTRARTFPHFWALLLLEAHNSVVQMRSLRYFHKIFLYKLMMRFNPFFWVLHPLRILSGYGS